MGSPGSRLDPNHERISLVVTRPMWDRIAAIKDKLRATDNPTANMPSTTRLLVGIVLNALDADDPGEAVRAGLEETGIR